MTQNLHRARHLYATVRSLVCASLNMAALLAVGCLSPSASPSASPSSPSSASIAAPATVSPRETTPPPLEIAPAQFTFGEVVRGAPLVGRVTLANRGATSLSLLRVVLLGAPSRLRFAATGAATGVASGTSASDDSRARVDGSDTASATLRALSLAGHATATLDFSIASDELASGAGHAQLLVEWSAASPAAPASLSTLSIPIDFAIASPAGATPLVAEPPVIDFGSVFRGEVLHHELRLTNPGPGDVAIDRVKHSCSCTASSFEIDGRRYDAKELSDARALGVLSPGESARLEVELQTTRVPRGQSEAHLSKVVLVYTADPAERPLALSLRATVVTPYFIEPATLELGRVRAGTGASASARLTSDQLGEFRITEAISGCPDALRVHFEREPIARDGQVAWRVRVELLPGAPLGTTLTHVEFAVDDPRLRTIVVPVQFTIEPNVDFLDNRPDRMELLDFGQVVLGVGATLELAIENRRPEVPYVPTKVELGRARPTGAGITVELVEKVAGSSYVVRLTVPPELAKASFFQGEVVITADHPEIPVKRVAYRGWYKPAGQ